MWLTRLTVRQSFCHSRVVSRKADETPTTLAELRKRQRLSRTQLAAAIGTSESAVIKWEQGARQPGLRSLRGLSEALGVSVDTLVRVLTADE